MKFCAFCGRSLKPRNLARLLVYLKDDVPADDDDDQQEYPKVIARDAKIASREIGRVLSDHAPKQRDGHVRVVA